ncbi:uncharacterized protein TNCV_1281701 [Trichonephila clavipes]|nr:uncharacterized protein TNCV_1281701 [Trichonephila clavipes]
MGICHTSRYGIARSHHVKPPNFNLSGAPAPPFSTTDKILSNPSRSMKMKLLQRRDIKILPMDDLRTVQFEIEEKLVSANRKRKQLENKISSLEILHSKNDKETVHSRKDKRFRSTDSIEKKNSDERPKKSEASSNKAHFSSNHPKSKYIPVCISLH